MYLDTQTRVQQAAREFVLRRYGVEANVVMDQPPRPDMGDMALPLAMELARRLRRPPRQLAEEIAGALRSLEGVYKVEVAGAGYVNLYLDRTAYAMRVGSAGSQDLSAKPDGEKIIVEHTNINPNKAAHIGHLRNAALGDTFVRLLRSRGHLVEVQNYIDNTGLQVADVVVGFLYLEQKKESDVARLVQDTSLKFDYYCWDLYAKVSRFYEEDSSRLDLRGQTLREIEEGGHESARVAEIVSTRIVQAHLATMERLDVRYDLLPRESEILHLRFWEKAFQLLKDTGAVFFETQGKNKGCWVMRQSTGQPAPPATPTGIDTPEAANAEETKVIVRSNGTVTYVGKDIAYQLWKFGLLGKDFFYRPFHEYSDGKTVWVSASAPTADHAPHFGGASRVFNVIDVRQSYLQNIVSAGLRALGYNEQADRSIHFSYEMVALSPRCCEEMGIELSPAERERPYIEVSGRKGLGVKADDLLDRLQMQALQEVDVRHPEESESFRRQVAAQIAIGALRYFLLKYTCTAVIAFDFREALSFEGETGPYVQYAAVRARNIFRKLREEGGTLDRQAPAAEILDKFLAPGEGDAFWQMLYLASRLEAAAEQAILTTEPAVMAKFAFQLAQAFNNFYHRFRILAEPDPSRKAFLLWLAQIVEMRLTAALQLLGIEVPEAM